MFSVVLPHLKKEVTVISTIAITFFHSKLKRSSDGRSRREDCWNCPAGGTESAGPVLAGSTLPVCSSIASCLLP